MSGWNVDATADTITFNVAPPTGTNNIVINEIATASFNATDLFAIGAWNGEYGYPGEVEFYADRLIGAATTAQPGTIWASRTGDYSFYGRSTPIQDDDSITGTLNARQLNQIRDLVVLRNLVILTSGGEWRTGGDTDEVFTPTTASFRPTAHLGSSKLPALMISQAALYCQNLGFAVTEIAYSFAEDGYEPSDLSAFAPHLVEKYALTDWCYQAVPHSAVFSVRDDGLLLAMTYKREQRVVAWSRLPTDGQVISVCTVREGKENAMYQAVRRTIGGVTKVFIERYGNQEKDYRDFVGVDCAVTYDGRNTTSKTMSLATGGGTWTPADTITITASAATFSATNVGDQLVLNYATEPLRITIFQVNSATEALGLPDRDVPVALRTPGTSWALAVDTLSGFPHLNGAAVRVGGDGYDYPERPVVSGGSVTITPPAVVAHVGLPYVCDFQSLDMTVIGGESVGARQKLIREVDVLLKSTRAIKAGTSFETLEEKGSFRSESPYLPPVEKTEVITLSVSGAWERNPNVCIRHDSAYPAYVLSVAPVTQFGGT